MDIKAALAKGARQAVIVGGGFIGLEVAEQLKERGLAVTVLEACPRLLPYMGEAYGTRAAEVLAANGVELVLGTTAQEVLTDKGKAVGIRTDGDKTYPADLVLFSVGVRPNSDLAAKAGLKLGVKGAISVDEHMATSDPQIWACGDCAETRHALTGKQTYIPLGTTANKQGRVAGSNIGGERASFRGVLGSQITKVFDLYIGQTGLTCAQAKEEGYQAGESTIRKLDRASYYPGGQINEITLVVDKASGKVLGAQAMGSETISGRLNLLAAAITAGLTATNLSELDLVYAPPVAPVYDPILIAGSQAEKLVKKA